MNYDLCKNEEEAVAWVKRNKKFFKNRFASIKDYPPDHYPSTIFMAGAPGAGKTEFSKLFIDKFYESEKQKKMNKKTMHLLNTRCIIRREKKRIITQFHHPASIFSC